MELSIGFSNPTDVCNLILYFSICWCTIHTITLNFKIIIHSVRCVFGLLQYTNFECVQVLDRIEYTITLRPCRARLAYPLSADASKGKTMFNVLYTMNKVFLLEDYAFIL